MASQRPDITSCRPTWKDIAPLDRLSPGSHFAQMIPAARAADPIFLVTTNDDRDRRHFQPVLYHCELERERHTFLMDGTLGKREDRPLEDSDVNERECRELCGKVLTKGFISLFSAGAKGVACVITDNIRDPVVSVALMDGDCLALTSSGKVYAFKENRSDETEVPGPEVIEIYAGIGGDAPCQIVAASLHFLILTSDGKVLAYEKSKITGDGAANNDIKPTLVESLGSKVDQIGYTRNVIYFLTGGMVLARRYDTLERVEALDMDWGRKPTTIDTKGYKIKTFRCSTTRVVALTTLGEVLAWGEYQDCLTRQPSVFEDHPFPAEIFSQATCKDTGGALYPVCLWTLQHSCRDAILRCIRKQQIDDLRVPPNNHLLPTKLKDFLKYGMYCFPSVCEDRSNREK